MGAAAYARGSAAIAEEIAREYRARHPVIRDVAEPAGWQEQRADYQARVAELRAGEGPLELALRLEAAKLRAERVARAEEQEQHERHWTLLCGALKRASAAADLMERRWRWVSAIVRVCVSPERVQAFREEERHAPTHPEENARGVLP
jgi:hypothetical protein